MMRPAFLIATLASSHALAAFCPSYTPSSSSTNGDNCAVEAAPGTPPTKPEWQDIFALVSKGPAAWGSNGPNTVNLTEGCNKPTVPQTIKARFPCELMKAIAYQESLWQQFCVPTGPTDQIGKPAQTIISFDCGYGIGQVTSGMRKNESPAFDRSRVAGDAVYNLATGMRILAEKWEATKCVGDGLTGTLEHWYTSTWAYNGLASINNPVNPNYSSTRGVWNPAVGGSRPYQEKVWGWMQYPPGTTYWVSLAAAYPNATGLAPTGPPAELPEPDCATPTDCTNKRATHQTTCWDAAPDAGHDAGFDAGDAGIDAGFDAGFDAGNVDAGFDAGVDAGSDAGFDAGMNPDPPDASVPEPLAFAPFDSQLGPAEKGCGCHGTSLSAAASLALLLLARRLRRSATH